MFFFKYVIRKVGFSLLFFLSYICYSQQNGVVNVVESNRFVAKTQIYFNAGSNIYNRLNITNEGEDWLKSRPGLGGVIGVGVNRKLTSRIGVTAGVDANVVSFNYRFNFFSEVDAEGVEVTNHSFRAIDNGSYISWNVGMRYLIPEAFDKYDLQFGLGFKRNTMPSVSVSSTTGYLIEGDDEAIAAIFKSDIKDFRDADGKSFGFTSYYSKIGLHRQNKKHNTVSFNLVFHFSPKKVLKGTYLFDNLDKQSNGNLTFGVNYIGLEFVYGFTFFKPK